MSANFSPISGYKGSASNERRLADLPIARVTVLEDRAQVERRGAVELVAGVNRLRIDGVSPLLQDVSLQAESSGAGVGAVSARVLRSRRILAVDRPEAVAELEAELEELQGQLQARRDRIDRAQQRHARLVAMLVSAARELPEDASWGRGDAASWRHAFERLFTRSREEDLSALDAYLEHERLLEEWSAVQTRRTQLDDPGTDLEAAVEVDLVTASGGTVELSLVYVVPSAMWRPLHRAELAGTALRWTPRACVWQRTGEPWNDVDLVLSTARTSSGTEPPLLHDDALQVQRKREEVRVAVRDVAIESVGPEGGGSAPPELPGVDDGGEARHLVVPGKVRVPSTGGATFFGLATREMAAEVDPIAMPEVAQRVVRRVRFTLSGSDPLLPGPVELLREGGPFATTSIDFTAPGAYQELSFGPDDDARVQREQDVLSDKVDPDDRWRRRKIRVRVYLSNVGTEERAIHVVERVPVSEIAAVRIEDVSASPGAEPDPNGHVHWTISLPPNGRATAELRYTLATAPEVQLG